MKKTTKIVAIKINSLFSAQYNKENKKKCARKLLGSVKFWPIWLFLVSNHHKNLRCLGIWRQNQDPDEIFIGRICPKNVEIGSKLTRLIEKRHFSMLYLIFAWNTLQMLSRNVKNMSTFEANAKPKYQMPNAFFKTPTLWEINS